MAEPLRLRTTLQRRGPAAAIVLSDEQVAALGGGAKTFAVSVTVGSAEPFAGRVARMGGENLIGLNKAVRTDVPFNLTVKDGRRTRVFMNQSVQSWMVRAISRFADGVEGKLNQ